MEHTNSLSRTASWVIVDKVTGKAMLEVWQASVAAKVNTDKYRAVPILEYLQSLNRKS